MVNPTFVSPLWSDKNWTSSHLLFPTIQDCKRSRTPLWQWGFQQCLPTIIGVVDHLGLRIFVFDKVEKIVQWNLDLRKILEVIKIFLKSRFFLISNTRSNHEKLLIKHKIANWTPKTMKMPISNGFVNLWRNFHLLNRKILKFYLKKYKSHL